MGELNQTLKKLKKIMSYQLSGGIFAFIISFIFYFETLAPSVLWGDSGSLQIRAYELSLRADALGHPLYIIIGKLFTLLPFGCIAFRVNLASAFFASLTVMLVYLSVFKLTSSKIASYTSAFILAISHTFWRHAVIAEVYTLNMFFLFLIINILLNWKINRNPKLLYLSSFIYGISLSNHLLMLLIIPGIFYFIIATNCKVLFSKKRLSLMVISFLLGLSLLFYLIFRSYLTSNIGLRGIVESALFGGLWKREILTFFLTSLPKNLVRYFAYLFYQFPLVSFLFGSIGGWQIFKIDKKSGIFLFLIFIFNILFAINYNVKDQYVFFLPSYGVFSIWIGLGMRNFVTHFNGKTLISLMLLGMLSFPIFLYKLTPVIIERMGIRLFQTRDIPGRNNDLYFLWPSQRNYFGAENYGRESLRVVEPNAIILADYTPITVLRYLQSVEQIRPDVKLIFIESIDVFKFIDSKIKEFPIYLADKEPYYQILKISEKYNIISQGPIFKVIIIDRGSQ